MISDRDGSDWDGQESYPFTLQCISGNGSRTDCADGQEHYGTGNLSTDAARLTSAVGRGIWDRRVACGDDGERASWQTLERHVQRQG